MTVNKIDAILRISEEENIMSSEDEVKQFTTIDQLSQQCIGELDALHKDPKEIIHRYISKAYRIGLQWQEDWWKDQDTDQEWLDSQAELAEWTRDQIEKHEKTISGNCNGYKGGF